MKVYIVTLDDYDVGEIEGAFNEKKEFIGWWCRNDANWRHEYFNGFMSELGIEVCRGTKALEKKLKKLVKDEV